MRRAGAQLKPAHSHAAGRVAGAARISPAAPPLDALERHRDHHFRRLPHRRISGEHAALRFIEEVGFCAAFTAGMGVPCLREAIEGRREPPLPEHIQHDRAIIMTWNIKDSLPARKLVYYGKVLGGRPSFIARDLLAAFLRLRAEPRGYRALYERGMLSHCARLVMDALSRRGAAETKALKLSAGYAQPKMRAEFDRAMKELQEKFLALKVEERYDPFTYVWDTMEHRWGEALREARALARAEAAYRIVRRYFEIAGFGNERALARVLALEPALVEGAARRLERERRVRRATRIDGLVGEFCVLTDLVG
ncbi:MAG TPA: hypothetical protein VFB33_00930 [Candidatus Binataceae bacterium]|jgi:hypothetical protein|nr:hypothetical protein [Candidatus Binataceae bacterium]